MAQRYFDVLAAQDDLDAQRGNLESVSRQLEQAEKRYQVGLIAITDVQEARAAHDSGAAAVIASKRQLAAAQESLREITGDGFDSLARPIEPFELTSPIRAARIAGWKWPCSRTCRWSPAVWRRTSRGRT